MTGKRLWALLLVLCLLLSGCSQGKEGNRVSASYADRQIKFTEMARQVEYAMLAATLQMPDFAGYGGPDDQAYLGDLDGDGDLEFVYGYELLTFDVTEEHFAYTPLSEYGYVYYLDKDNQFWAYGVFSDVDNSDTEWFESYSAWYQQWDGSQWNTVMACSANNTYYYTDGVVADNPHTIDFSGEINGESVDKATWDGHLADLALTEVSTTSRDFTSFTTEKLYRNAIEKDLYEYLVTYYDCSETVTFDADSDGQNESYFAVRNPFRLWAETLEQDSNYLGLQDWLGYDYDSDYTVYIVADPEDDSVIFSTYCVSGYRELSQSGIYYSNGCLGINGDNLGLSGDYRTIRDLDSQQKETAYTYLLDTLENQGYSCYGFKWTDLSDGGNGEMLCILSDGNGYMALLFTLKNGRFVQVWQIDLNASACYLVMKDGKQYLLEYTQRVDNSSGDFYTHYSYDLFRFDENYGCQIADSQSVSYNGSEKDATAVSNFFAKFNGLFTNTVVLGDPFSVTGNQWGTSADMDYGSLPQNPTTSEGRLGYVQIEDPASFLFLREGPGKHYDPVLIDPNDPDSFVRQAQGSPVIILEEVVTGDDENPVWVRLRIHYGDREVVGYSSKRYIREAN